MVKHAARRWALALVILSTATASLAFPTFVGGNGSVTVETAFGGNLILKPDAGGALLSPRDCAGVPATYICAQVT